MTNIISSRTVKIAKPHNCWGCKKKLSIGSRIMAVKQVDGDRISTAYWCDICDGFLSTLPSYLRGTEWECGELMEFEGYPVEINKCK